MVAPEEADQPLFSLAVSADGDGRTTVAASGELDLTAADGFAAAVGEALAAGAVLIDLSAVTFMDSAGVRALNTALRESARRGRELKVGAHMQKPVVQVLEMTGMMGLLPVDGRS
jgi:anti-sigma B factor antagonist